MNLVSRSLFDLLTGYAELFPPSKHVFPADISPIEVHDFVLERILLNTHLQKYPPSKQYQRSFWKWAIRELENALQEEDYDIDARIFDHYLETMSSSGPALGATNPNLLTQLCPRGLPLGSPRSESFITHYWSPVVTPTRLQGQIDLTSYYTTTLLESRTIIEGGTTGLRTWLASLILAGYLISNPSIVLGRRILELGSGVGYLGIIVASLQVHFESTSPIWLTDVNDAVLSRCSDNVKLQGNLSSRHPDVTTQFVDWFAALDTDQFAALQSRLSDEINADVVLGADIVRIYQLLIPLGLQSTGRNFIYTTTRPYKQLNNSMTLTIIDFQVFDPSLIPALVATLELALSQAPNSGVASTKKRTALIALTVRNPATIDLFLQQARDRLDVSEIDLESLVDMQHGHDDGSIDGSDAQQNVKLLSITAKL